MLAEVSLAIRAGEFIGVFGPNGAGKTTLLHAILGLLPPLAGELKVLGAAPARGNRAAGYLPQQRASVAELCLRGWDFVASAYNGDRWGLPRCGRAGRRDVDRVIATGRGAAARRAAVVRTLRRRTAAAAASAGAARQAAAAAARRAVPEPRPAFPAGDRRAGQGHPAGARHHGAVHRARTQSAARRHGSGALPRAGPRRTGQRRGSDHERGALAPVRRAHRCLARSTSACWSSPDTAWSMPMPTATMFEYEFMRTAFLAGSLVAIVAGAVGFFLVLRNLTFAGHALSHVGFAGATGAVLVGVSPAVGAAGLHARGGAGHGTARRAPARARCRRRHHPLARARPRRVVPVPLHQPRDPGDGDPVRQCAGRRPADRLGPVRVDRW